MNEYVGWIFVREGDGSIGFDVVPAQEVSGWPSNTACTLTKHLIRATSLRDATSYLAELVATVRPGLNHHTCAEDV